MTIQSDLEPPRLVVDRGPFYDRDGFVKPETRGKFFVLEHRYVGRHSRPIRVLAACTSAKAANAARRLLSGECEVKS